MSRSQLNKAREIWASSSFNWPLPDHRYHENGHPLSPSGCHGLEMCQCAWCKKTGMCRRELENHIVHASTCTLPCPTSKSWTNMDQYLPGRRFSAGKGPEKPMEMTTWQPFSTPSKASKTSHTVAAVPVPMVSLRLVTQNIVPHYLLLGASRLNKTLVCLVVPYLLYMFINFIPHETSR